MGHFERTVKPIMAEGAIALHYIKLHYIILYFIRLHYIHYITLMKMGMGIVNGTLGKDGQTYYGRGCNCITLYQITLHYITLHRIT